MREIVPLLVLMGIFVSLVAMKYSVINGRHDDPDTGGSGVLRCLLGGAWLGTERDRRNRVAILRWAVVLAASLIASVLMLKAGLGEGSVLKWAIAAVPVAALVPWLLAHLRFLREADELVRKIQLEGVAVGFAAAFGFGLAYSALVYAGGPRLSPSGGVSIMIVVMALGYAFGGFLASKRYR